MKKTDFVLVLANKTDISQAKANEYLNAMLEVITDALKAGDKVTLTGFGTFEVRDRAARMVTDIRSKEKKQTPASKYPAFSAGAVLKDAVRIVAKDAAKPVSTSAVSSTATKPTPAKSAPSRATPSKAVAKSASLKTAKSSAKKPATKAKHK